MRAIRAGPGGFRRPIFDSPAVKRTQQGRQKYLPGCRRLPQGHLEVHGPGDGCLEEGGDGSGKEGGAGKAEGGEGMSSGSPSGEKRFEVGSRRRR
jgi:hypothetical protein